jgi:O-antigen/teichoic acid export membrane protein
MVRSAVLLAHRYLLSLSGEWLQSGFHFILNLVLIRLLSAYDYGVFAIIFILGGIALTYGNALVSVPATVHIPRLKSAGAVNFQDVVLGSVALAICGGIAVIAAAGLWLTLGSPGEALAGAAFVGLWTLRNHLRATMFARREMATATLADLSYFVSGIVLIGALLLLERGAIQVAEVLAALAVANLLAIAVGLKGQGRRPRVSLRAGVRARYRAIWQEIAWSLVAVTTWSVQGQAQMFLVAAIVGPAAYAPIAAGIVLFRPLRTAVGALVNVIRPEFATALADRALHRVKLTIAASFAAVTLGCLAYGLLVLIAWSFLTEQIFGEKFSDASMPLIVTLAWVGALISLSYHVPLPLVQAARDFKTVAVATAIGGLAGVVAVVVLLFTASVAWSLAGVAIGEAVCWVILCIASMRIVAGLRASPAASPPRAPSVIPAPEMHA